MPTKHAARKTAANTPTRKRTDPSGAPQPSDDGIPSSRTDTKEETRLFQRGPDQKVWLTRDEAKNEGFYWNDNPDEEVNPPN